MQGTGSPMLVRRGSLMQIGKEKSKEKNSLDFNEIEEIKAIREDLKVIKIMASEILNKFNDDSKKTTHGTITLNVGGKHFTTTKETLTKDPKCVFARIFSESPSSSSSEPKPKCEKDGSYFFDRDPKHFRHILNYLRNGKLEIPDNDDIRRELLTEAQFYQIEGIVKELVSKPPKYINGFKDMIVLSEGEDEYVGNGLEGKTGYPKVISLFRGSKQKGVYSMSEGEKDAVWENGEMNGNSSQYPQSYLYPEKEPASYVLGSKSLIQLDKYKTFSA